MPNQSRLQDDADARWRVSLVAGTRGEQQASLASRGWRRQRGASGALTRGDARRIRRQQVAAVPRWAAVTPPA